MTLAADRIIPMRVGTRYKTSASGDTRKDHPHACGDKNLSQWYDDTRAGSSPCVWGQDKKICFYRHNTRIIPMRVGTSLQNALDYFLAKDHPHACGDKCVMLYKSCPNWGSSPCVWGQVTHDNFFLRSNRIIPMRVGTSCQ